MKKRWSLVILLLSTLCLTSCVVEVHFGSYSTYVPWYFVVIPCVLFVLLLFVIVQLYYVRKTYTCPECQNEFRPRWYEISVWVHDLGRHVVRCPQCGKRGFCRKK